jgi:hypothetical protein
MGKSYWRFDLDQRARRACLTEIPTLTDHCQPAIRAQP